MDETLKKERFPAAITIKIAEMYRKNNSITNDIALINIKRIYYLSLIIIPLRILNILLFTGSAPEPKAWSQGIIASHFTILVFWVGVFFVAHQLKDRKEANAAMHALQHIIPVFTMASGVVIVTIDQLVTTNITPFMLVSIVVGAVFLIRPLISSIIFLASYLAYYFLIALTTANPQVLLSNRVNGITTIFLSLFLSIMIWQSFYTNITQKRRIERQQKQLERLAYYDQLTNLYNRHFFDKMLEKEFSSVQRYGHKSVIIIFDIDDFKSINDTYGHHVGDQVLKQLAELIVGNVREADTVARFGGEEFIILAPKISLEEGFLFAEKLRKLVAEKKFATGPDSSYITASFGVSLLQATEKYGTDIYFSQADKALYLAKEKGKNRVEMAS